MPSDAKTFPRFISEVEVFENFDGTLIVAVARDGFVHIPRSEAARTFIEVCAGGLREPESIEILCARREVQKLYRALDQAGMLAWQGVLTAMETLGCAPSCCGPGKVLPPAFPRQLGRLSQPTMGEWSVIAVSGRSWADMAVAGLAYMDGTEPWVFVHGGGPGRFITPVIGGRDGACWKCLLRRLSGLDDVFGYLLPRIMEGSCRRLSVPDERHAAPAVLSEAEWVRAAGGGIGRDVLLHLDDMRSPAHHHFTDVAGCEHSPPRQHGMPSFSVKVGDRESHRSRQPVAESWERLRARAAHLVDSVTGLVCPPVILSESPIYAAMTRYADTGGPGSVIVVDERGRIGSEPSLCRETFGSGITQVEAETVAILEGLERYCQLAQGHDRVTSGEVGELRSAHLCGKAKWLCVRQPGESCNCSVTDWAETGSLDGEAILVPAHRCYRGVGEARFLGSPRGFTSTGVALGQYREDAVVAGFLEIIERESVTRWWDRRAAHPSLRLGGLDDPLVRSMVTHHETTGRSLAVFAIPATIQTVYVFVAVSGLEELGFPLLGMGASLHPLTGVRRALKEMGQAMACEEAEKRKWQGFSPVSQRHLRRSGTRTWSWPAQSSPEREWGPGALSAIREAASAAGRRICVLAYDRPEVPFACVRVLLPWTSSYQETETRGARAVSGDSSGSARVPPAFDDRTVEHIRW